VHPLLQSLNFKFPASNSSTHNAGNCQSHKPCSNAAQQDSKATLAAAADSCSLQAPTAAAAALANALKQGNSCNTHVHSSPVHQLLASFAAAQQQQQLKQLKQPQRPCAAATSSAQLAVVTPEVVITNKAATSAHRRDCSSCGRLQQSPSIKFSSAAGPQCTDEASAATPAAAARRPVTAHSTKPHRPGSIKLQPASHRAACQQHAACSSAESAHAGVPACARSTIPVRPSPASYDHMGAGSSSSGSSNVEHPLPAAVRPGTAAAFRIVRSMGVTSCVSRPATCSGSSSSRPGRTAQQLNEQHLSTLTSQQQQPQQQQAEGAEFSRPATAELRALLASSHSKDGIAERLEYYR
jgi:hypothetical protein